MSKAQEEISIREMLKLFQHFWNKAVNLFLLCVLFVIKHLLPLVLLSVIGMLIAYFHKESKPTYKQDFIVSTTEYSGEFLYQKLMEINLKFATNNQEFKDELSLGDIDMKEVSYSVKPIYTKGAAMDNNEYQYLKYITDNKIIDKNILEQMMQKSNLSYEIEMLYPYGLDGLSIFKATLQHLRENLYASEIHQAVLSDIEEQLKENKKILFALGDYVEALGNTAQGIALDKDAVVIGGKNADLGSMLYAREQTQKSTSRLSVKKIQLSENFRLLIEGNPSRFYGKGLIKNKMLIYPVALILGYVFIVFGVYVIRKALELKAETNKETRA